jgi:hypothetical protein
LKVPRKKPTREPAKKGNLWILKGFRPGMGTEAWIKGLIAHYGADDPDVIEICEENGRTDLLA